MVPLRIWVKSMEKKRHTEKQALRKQYLGYRDAQTVAERIRKSRQILARLAETDLFLQAGLLLIYMDFRSEVLTTPLVEQLLLKNKKKIFCPKVMGENMAFYEITQMNQLTAGCWGIREPEETEKRIFTAEHYQRHQSLMILPGAVFDRNRGRIGYGKGYYDRFLTSYPDMPTIALAYHCQIAPAVPMEAYDRRPDMIITESETIV